MKRRTVVWRIAGVAAFGVDRNLKAVAQPAAKISRIGILRWGAPGDDAVLSLTQALAAIGYRENQTIAIEWRFATSQDMARQHVAEFAGLHLDLLVGFATPAVAALRELAKSVPMVMAGAADPVGSGLVASLARPGGNITGVSFNLPAMVPRQLQLLAELIGGLQRVAFLGSSDDPATQLFVEQAQTAARTLRIQMQVVLASQANGFDAAVDAMLRERAQAVIVQPLFVISRPEPLADLLARRKLPSVSAAPFALAGGLMTYGYSRAEVARRAASFVDRVLKGAKPASLPVEEPTAYEPVINLKTARELGLTIPRPLLLRADEVMG